MLDKFFHMAISGIIMLVGAIVCLFLLIFVLVIIFKLLRFIYGLLRFAFLRMTAGMRQRHAILKSLSDSEKSCYKSSDSLYEQHLHLMAGIKKAEENKMWLSAYKKRMVVQLEKTTNDPKLEASKSSYLIWHSESIEKAKAKAKARGEDWDFDLSSPVYIFDGFDFDLPDFDGFDFDFPDIDFPDLDF